MIEVTRKDNNKPTLETINPFEFIKENSNGDISYIIGHYVYEQEPCSMTIDYVVKHDATMEDVIELINTRDINIGLYRNLERGDILYIPYSVFKKYMDGRIEDYVENDEYIHYNEFNRKTIYSYEFIVIDLTK